MELFKRLRGGRPIPLKNPSKTQQQWYPKNSNNFILGNPYPTFKIKQREFISEIDKILFIFLLLFELFLLLLFKEI